MMIPKTLFMAYDKCYYRAAKARAVQRSVDRVSQLCERNYLFKTSYS
jgi:hypothetical protein